VQSFSSSFSVQQLLVRRLRVGLLTPAFSMAEKVKQKPLVEPKAGIGFMCGLTGFMSGQHVMKLSVDTWILGQIDSHPEDISGFKQFYLWLHAPPIFRQFIVFIAPLFLMGCVAVPAQAYITIFKRRAPQGRRLGDVLAFLSFSMLVHNIFSVTGPAEKAVHACVDEQIFSECIDLVRQVKWAHTMGLLIQFANFWATLTSFKANAELALMSQNNSATETSADVIDASSGWYFALVSQRGGKAAMQELITFLEDEVLPQVRREGRTEDMTAWIVQDAMISLPQKDSTILPFCISMRNHPPEAHTMTARIPAHVRILGPEDTVFAVLFQALEVAEKMTQADKERAKENMSLFGRMLLGPRRFIAGGKMD